MSAIPTIPQTGDHSSSDDEGYWTKVITLTRDNWVQWSCQLENFLAGKGHESLLSPPSESDKISLKFKKRNGSALALLWTCVCSDMHGVLLAHDSWEALGKACGKNSVVVMCETLFKLMSLQFEPGSSLEKHIDTFQKTYANYESITQNSANRMTISSDVAAAFFIRSLNQDRELSGLVQTLYDIKPFKLNNVLDRVAEPEQSKSSKQGGSQNKNRGGNRGRGKSRTNANPKRNEESLKRLELLEKRFAKLELDAKNSNVNVITDAHKETPRDFQHSDSDAYVTTDKVLTLGSGVPDQIYLDSGAGRSVVNNLSFLTNVTQVKKQVNTYADPVRITHQGTLIFRGIHLSPVYYAPEGKVNLLVKDWKDWHPVLGHPSDEYIRKLLDNKKLSGSFTPSNECQIHIDTLEISPPSQQGNCYVLVIVDDYSRFNRIYLMSEKGKAEGYISSYLNELKNKLSITPGYIHTDQGGEFDSKLFRSLLISKGISLERGPPHSPQTNGVAERFNQSLLTKIRCLLAHSNIPISLWEEAAMHASMLLNHLPHKFLGMKSPNDLLVSKSSTIQPVRDLSQLLPFGIKVMVKNEFPISKVHVVGKVMKALTYEPYSDALRVLDPISGKIKITQDFSQLKSDTTVILRKDPLVLPAQAEQSQPRMVNLAELRRSISKRSSLNEDDSEAQLPADRQTVDHEPVSQQEISSERAKSRYTYVPYYDTAPLDVSSGISTQNIIKGERRQRKAPDRFMLADVVTYKQALSDPNEEEAWRSAMKSEYDSLMNHNTGKLVPYPSNGAKENLLHYFDTWASVGRNETFKVLLILVVTQAYIPYQFDIETAFLHGEMDANVYIEQVKGFEVPGKEGWVWRLKKSLYGTKQAPRMWQAKLVSVLQELDLTSTRADNSVYSNQDRTLFLHVHVDDGFIIGKNEKDLLIFLEKLNRKLSLKYQRKPTHHLGYHIDWETDRTVYLSQQDLILQLLRDHDMDGSQDVKTPCNGNLLKELESVRDPVRITAFQQAIGSLNCLAQHTWPDISFTVNALSRHTAHPTDKHWVALKHLLQYLKGSSGLCLHYKKAISKEHDVIGWADADYANDRMDRKSITGNLITFCGNPVSWLSKKQSVVAQSTTEAEFISMNICAKQLRWMTYLLQELNQKLTPPIIYNDNSGAVIISSQASLNPNIKHIEIRYQYVRDLVLKNLLTVKQVGTNSMITDALTKPLGIQKVADICNKLHLENQGGLL
ncbi:hypothetical protein O181_075382 [Austropuccinia psidii MF-1]|uniref:Integrase catalytic domain-containing protein n=1 Tax=Austropuccinia psidii MF-1 TaxID=1389203 RepID=A0A9Q3FEW2_9BASI|nr:hypothetical protein [Austropuccinia psidii MF-1]